MDLTPIDPILTAAASGAVVKVFVQLVKPWIEKALKPSDPAHDGTLQFLVFMLNAALVVGAAILAHSFAWSGLLDYLAMAAGGTTASLVLYHTGGKSSGAGPVPVVVQGSPLVTLDGTTLGSPVIVPDAPTSPAPAAQS